MIALTHPGRAHRDEFLSLCILLNLSPGISRIVRREVCDEDLLSKEVLVVDAGEDYNPLFLNFDHHQMEAVWERPVCALTLILRHFGLEEVAHNVWPWLAPTEAGDVFGLSGMAAAAGVDKTLDIRPLLSPIERAMLDRFGAVLEITADEPLFRDMQVIGDLLCTELRDVTKRLETLRASTKVIQFGHGLTAVLNKLPREQQPETGFSLFLDKTYPDSVVAIVEDQRGRGWKLFRRKPDGVDFRKLRDLPEIGFTHSNGFLCTTRAQIPVEQLTRLLDQAA